MFNSQIKFKIRINDKKMDAVSVKALASQMRKQNFKSSSFCKMLKN